MHAARFPVYVSTIFRNRAASATLKACRINAFQFLNFSNTVTRSVFQKSNIKFQGIQLYPLRPILLKHRLLSSVSNQEEQDSKDVLVYEGKLRTVVKWCKLFSLSSSMVGFAFQPFVLYNILKINVAACVIAGVMSTLFLATPLILNYITKSYVIELHFNPKTKVFTAKTYNLFSQIQEIQYTAEDVTVPDLPGMLSSFVVKKTPLFVDATMIEDPDAYSHMMGYDKPLDLLLHDLIEKDQSKETTGK